MQMPLRNVPPEHFYRKINPQRDYEQSAHEMGSAGANYRHLYLQRPAFVDSPTIAQCLTPPLWQVLIDPAQCRFCAGLNRGSWRTGTISLWKTARPWLNFPWAPTDQFLFFRLAVVFVVNANGSNHGDQWNEKLMLVELRMLFIQTFIFAL